MTHAELENVQKARKERKDGTRQLLTGLCVAVLLLTVGFGWQALLRHQDSNALEKFAIQYEDVRDATKDLCKDKANAEKPECAVIPPPAEKVVEDASGDAVLVSPGRPGRDGPSISTVRALIEAEFNSCVTSELCVGTDGKNAKNGEDGVTPSNAFLAGLAQQTLINFCADGRCTPTNGTDGSDGKDGRGIVTGPTCQDDGTWKTTFDKEPFEETQPGPCKVVVGP